MWSLAMNSRTLAARGHSGIIVRYHHSISSGPGSVGPCDLVGVYALVSGGSAPIAAMKKGVEGRGSLLLEALAGIFIGLATLVWLGLTMLILTYLIGAWAIVTGIFEIAGAIGLRQYIRNEWLYLLGGAFSILLGLWF